MPKRVKVKSVKSSVGGGRSGSAMYTTRVGPKGLAQKRAEVVERFQLATSGLGEASISALNDIAGIQNDDGASHDDAMYPDGSQFHDMGAGIDSDDDHTAQGAGEGIQIDIREVLAYNRYHGIRVRKDGRTWARRLRKLEQNWAPYLASMTDAYTHWRYHDRPAIVTFKDPNAFPAVDGWDFDIAVIDLHNLARVAVIPRDPDTPAAIALVKAGFLGTVPENPSIAISLRTLDLYHTMRLFKPTFSIEAFAKVICHTLKVPYRRTYRTHLSDAFDTYLELRRRLDAQVKKELGQDTPDYRVTHSCPCCHYELTDENPLHFSFMWAFDGNNSLKRMDGLGSHRVADQRVFASDYYLSDDFVDRFKDEVKSRKAPPEAHAEEFDDDETELFGEGGDPTDGGDDEHLKRCTRNWKAASADGAKKMWGIFRESGIFASACRHGLILWICDMIRSGELAKYPLAMVSEALRIFGPRWLLGYDIGCSFAATIEASSLGPAFKEKRARCCVNAFHGYSHNAYCQHANHPNNITGMGLEDLETLERTFSLSNQLASITRYMTAYRRRLFIDMYFQQVDRDKYQALATMLHNNYRQALALLKDDAETLRCDLAAADLTEADLEGYWADQQKHFEVLGAETEYDVNAIEYVALLQKLRAIETSIEQGGYRTQVPADWAFLNSDTSYGVAMSETRKTETKTKYLKEQHANTLFEVIKMETNMGITRRWTPLDPEYMDAARMMNQRKYRQELEKLHGLVVQRLWELHKMNLSQTGYKMRTHIAQALQRRSKAIRNAVNRYNTAAQALDPPRPTLDWAKVSHYSFLDQFDILADTRHSVMSKPWAHPVTRELMWQQRRVARAREEITRLNIELRRLHTSIVDERKHFDSALQRLKEDGSPLYEAVEEYVQLRSSVNQLLLARLEDTYRLPGFTGTPQPGVAKSPVSMPQTPPGSHQEPSVQSTSHQQHPPSPNSRQPSSARPSISDGVDSDVELDGGNEDDEFVDELGGVVDYISNLTI